jgi:crotonobetainyl-CoA:carnitine CoA-transferase CaiB-like acyl-CoA transferase
LSKTSDQLRLKELIKSSDILIENFKVGGLKKYGFDYESVKSINPALIYCSITGFGQTGPYSHRAGYDYIIQGMSGFMSITGESGEMPQRAGVAVTDLFTGLYATTAILSAIHLRNETGKGQHIDMALLDCAVSVMVNQAMNFMSTGISPDRVGNIHPNLCPYQVFECANGHLIIAVGNDGQFSRLCRILKLGSLSNDPLFLTNKQRVLNREQLTAMLSDAIKLFQKDELLKLCENSNVPAGPINKMEEVFKDPQVIFREMQLNFGQLQGVASPFKFSDAKLNMRKPSPRLGQDDTEF